MHLILLFLPSIFLAGFYLIPIIANIEDPRLWTKLASLIFLITGIISVYKIFKIEPNKKVEGVFRKPREEIIFTVGLICIISFAFLYTLFQHLHSFFLVDYDFLAIAEILNNSIAGNFFQTHHYGKAVTGNYLSHHFAPSLLLLTPFMLLSKFRLGYAYGLLFFVALSFVLFAVLLIRKNIRGNIFYAAMILLAVNLPLHRLFFSYHFELLTVFFFLLFFAGKEFNKTYISILAIILLLLLKEDMAIYTFCLGMYFALNKKWRYATSLMVASLVYFFLIPSFFQSQLDKSTHINWLEDWSKWGNSYSEILFNLITSPMQVLNTFLSKWKVLREFIFSFSPLIFISPSLIIVSLPIFILHFISDRVWYNSLYNYYSYTVVSFFILSMVFSIERLENSKYKKYTLSIVLFCIFISLYSSSGDKFFPYTKIDTKENRVNDLAEVIQSIPVNKTVATQFDLGAFLPRANPLYPLHEKNLDKDYLLIDLNGGITPYVDKPRIERMIKGVTANQSYSLVIQKNGIMLYAKK
jgi:uncharacterized membrane protein